ncbi:response regulator transcription factor [Paenibacillus sp. PAMC21692]|uniref:response regulator n=1 Tax=Paenibacillus sp. PAMC21692 TaxID=2762320 RepID=UPI00164D0CDD|nr:response regulator transcription factor [Paenibacillus sp. PAMC21692]QNK59809.1 response regulator transcription factor [Paenibacillus sp. PAMC21692]
MTENGPVGQVSVLIVDDHPHGREGMRDLLGADPSFRVVGEAVSGEEAIAKAADLVPDLVLMDIRMPGMGGLDATFRLKQLLPSVKIVMVTVSDDITHLFEAIKRGAQGYLLKNVSPASWLSYLRSVAMDEAPLSKELALRMLREFAAKADGGEIVDSAGKVPEAGRGTGVGVPSNGLTPREKEVLEHISTGASNREIASTLCLSEHTVKNHLKNILQKLHLNNRVQLARYAMENGLQRRE